MERKKKTVIIIAGPTASGKTALAIQLARHYNTSIISADSRQCFRELNIGVAKPSSGELEEVKHYFINSHSVQEKVTADIFETYALNVTEEIFQQSDVVIMAGGTGLYIRAFCEGFDAIPEIDPIIRENIRNLYKFNGLEWLQKEVSFKDPVFWKHAEQQNPQRLMRGLEVFISTGKSIMEFRSKAVKKRDFNLIKLGILTDKEQLHKNINRRVDLMIQSGLIEEVKSLVSYRHLNALQTVGYTELFEFLDEKINLETAIEQIKHNTRQYAKRQLTWFAKDKEIQWVVPEKIFNKTGAFLTALNTIS